MTQLFVATRNAHKTSEIALMLKNQYVVSDLNGTDFPIVEETGSTFLENATLKAVEISQLTEGIVLSDDSGLEVDALDGEPGVYSSRYAGKEGDNAANNLKLIRELAQLPSTKKRSARFRCVMVLAKNGAVMASFEGAVEGEILETPRGGEGFGYDPLFQPEGYTESFAELGPDVKNTLSHRAVALRQVIQWLAEQA